MAHQITEQIRAKQIYIYLIILVVASTIGLQSWQTLFNNFANDTVNLNGNEVGLIQSIREIPGFLSFTAIFILLIIKESIFAGLMVLLLGVSISITGFFPSYNGLLVTTLLMSIAFHYFETSNQSLTLQSFSKTETPIVLGKFRSIIALTSILVGATIYILDYFLEAKYQFLIMGVIVAAMVSWFFIFKKIPSSGVPQKKRLLLKRKYWLFYVLTFLSGARRQIFVVFAIFMLVDKYEYSIKHITILFLINNIIAYFAAPYIGKLINKFGERIMLATEYITLIALFLCYGFIENEYLVGVLFIIDNLLFNFAICINTYFQKIADKQDIAPSMSTGFTINHIMAVIIPYIGGLLYVYNWRIPFFAGAVIALISLFFTRYIQFDKNRQ